MSLHVSRLAALRALDTRLQATAPSPARDALRIDIGERMAELSGSTDRPSAWRERVLEVRAERGQASVRSFYG